MLQPDHSEPAIVVDEPGDLIPSDPVVPKSAANNQTECRLDDREDEDGRDPEEVEAENAEKRHLERIRRARLYGVTSRHPPVVLSNHHVDVRCRLDLEALANQHQKLREQMKEKHADLRSKRLPAVHELENQKQKDDCKGRPSLNGLIPMHDLMTTVPRDLEALSASKPICAGGGPGQRNHQHEPAKPWRVGYQNVSTDYHLSGLGIDGILEPSPGACEVLLLSSTTKPNPSPSKLQSMPSTPSDSTIHGPLVHPSFRATCVAYPPVVPSDVATWLKPTEFVEGAKANQDSLQGTTRPTSGCSSATSKAPWRPASSKPTRSSSTAKPKSQKHHTASPNQTQLDRQRTNEGQQPEYDKALEIHQRFPLRKNEPKHRTELHVDERCVHYKKKLFTRLAISFQRLQHAVDKHKKSSARYALPIENSTCARSYRLGLELPPRLDERQDPQHGNHAHGFGVGVGVGHGSPTQSPKSRLVFRPKSAVMHRTSLTTSTKRDDKASFAVGGGFTDLSRVAGAKRRPRSAASVSYLHSATVFCLDSDPNNPELGSNRLFMEEQQQRRRHREEVLDRLIKQGAFTRLPLDQLFLRLKARALLNLQRGLQKTYEDIGMEEYLALVQKHQRKSARRLSSQQPPESDIIGPKQGREQAQEQQETEKPLPPSLEQQLAAQTQDASHFFSLVLTREQFVESLRDLAICDHDLNGFFSILDEQITNKVHVHEVLQQAKCMRQLMEQQRNRRLAAHASFATTLFKH